MASPSGSAGLQEGRGAGAPCQRAAFQVRPESASVCRFPGPPGLCMCHADPLRDLSLPKVALRATLADCSPGRYLEGRLSYE